MASGALTRSSASMDADQQIVTVQVSIGSSARLQQVRVLYTGTADDLFAAQLAVQLARSEAISVRILTTAASAESFTAADFMLLREGVSERVAPHISFKDLLPDADPFVRKAQGDRPWHVYIKYILQAGYHTPINTTSSLYFISRFPTPLKALLTDRINDVKHNVTYIVGRSVQEDTAFIAAGAIPDQVNVLGQVAFDLVSMIRQSRSTTGY
jgi:hypothetical protein